MFKESSWSTEALLDCLPESLSPQTQIVLGILAERIDTESPALQERFVEYVELRSRNFIVRPDVECLARTRASYRAANFAQAAVQNLFPVSVGHLVRTLPAEESIALLGAYAERGDIRQVESMLRRVSEIDTADTWQRRVASLAASQHADIRLLAIRYASMKSEPAVARQEEATPAPKRSR